MHISSRCLGRWDKLWQTAATKGLSLSGHMLRLHLAFQIRIIRRLWKGLSSGSLLVQRGFLIIDWGDLYGNGLKYLMFPIRQLDCEVISKVLWIIMHIHQPHSWKGGKKREKVNFSCDWTIPKHSTDNYFHFQTINNQCNRVKLNCFMQKEYP